MAHAIARRSRRRRRHANPYKAGRGRRSRWHRLDGKFAKRAGGRYLRRVGRHALRSNPHARRRRHRARHSRALSRLFANPFHTGRGRKRRLRRLDGRFSKRNGYGRARRHGRHMVKHNPSKRRRRHGRRRHNAMARYNPSRKRRARRSAKRGKRRARRRAKRGKRRARRRGQRVILITGAGEHPRRTIIAPHRLTPVRRTMVGY